MAKDSRIFYIKHDKEGFSIQLETHLSEFQSLEQLLHLTCNYYLSKGKYRELESIIQLIKLRIDDSKTDH